MADEGAVPPPVPPMSAERLAAQEAAATQLVSPRATSYRELTSRESIREIAEFSSATLGLGGLVSSFLKKKAAMQTAYASQLHALVSGCQTRLKEMHAEGLPEASSAPVVELCKTFLKLNADEADTMEVLAEGLENDLSESLENALKMKKSTVAFLRADREQMSRRLRRLELEVEHAFKNNEEAMRALNAARKVTENAAGNPKKLERAIAAENDAANIKRNAHNTYVLELASANAERKKLFSEDLPELLERMEEAQVRAIRETAKAIENASRLTNVTLQKICQKHEGVFSAAAMVDGKEDVAAWVKKLDCQPAPPPVDLTFVALPNSGPVDELAPASNELIVDGAEDVLAQRIQVLSAQVAELASKIGQESHIAHGIEKMVDEYRKNPGFGSADAIVDRLFAAQNAARDTRTRMSRLHATLGVLESAQVATPKGKVSTHVWETQSYQTLKKCNYCHKLLIGLTGQGEHCRICSIDVHRRCIQYVPACRKPDAAGGDAAAAAASEAASSSKPDTSAAAAAAAQAAAAASAANTAAAESESARSASPQPFRPSAAPRSPVSLQKHESIAIDDEDYEENWSDDEEEVYEPVEGKVAMAIFDYTAQKDDEVTMRSGDVAQVLVEDDSDWWKVACGDRIGLVPAAYLRSFSGDPRGQMRALYSYEAMNDDELSFEENALIELIEPDRDGWSKGRLAGKVGLFPTSYCEQQESTLTRAGSTRPGQSRKPAASPTPSAAASDKGGENIYSTIEETLNPAPTTSI